MDRDTEPDRYRRLLRRLQRRALRLVGHPETAADLAQEAALRLWQRQSLGGDLDNAEAYAMTVLSNLAASHWRARRSTEVLEDDMVRVLPAAPGRLALADLLAAVDRLPPDQARLLRLVAGGMTSPADLARRTGLPPGTVMSRLARARASLRETLDLDGPSPSASLLDMTPD